MVVIGQIWLKSGKTGCNQEKVVVFVQKWFYLVKRCCFGAKLLYSEKSGSNRAKVVVVGQKWL